MLRALEYMGLEANTPLTEIPVDKVFIGSCTNARIEDLRSAAAVVRGHKKAKNIMRAMIVPGSGLVKRQAEEEGLDKVFLDSGFEWREAGCSMCLGMNPDILSPKERCASTSNRNFEGRQGYQGRTHLMSPAMAAAAAITGHITDIRTFKINKPETAKVEISSDEDEDLKTAAYNHEEPVQPSDAPTDIEEDEVDDIPSPVKSDTKASSGGMNPFTTLTGIAAPLDKANVDTDAIIPKQFLKTIKRTGLSVGLFYEWRFQKDANGKDKETDFVLNVEPWRNAEVLVVTGDNFGCGSSREHAPWALKDFGIKCMIAPSFGDIFYNNSFKNGLLPIRVDAKVINEKLIPIARNGGQLKIDLPNQNISDDQGNVLVPHFEVEEFRKYCLLNGFDDISLTLQLEDFISKYEKVRKDKYSFWEGGSALVKFPVDIKEQKFVKPKPLTTYDVVHQDW